MSVCLIVVFRIVIMLSLPLFFIGSLYTGVWMMQIYLSVLRVQSSGRCIRRKSNHLHSSFLLSHRSYGS